MAGRRRARDGVVPARLSDGRNRARGSRIPRRPQAAGQHRPRRPGGTRRAGALRDAQREPRVRRLSRLPGVEGRGGRRECALRGLPGWESFFQGKRRAAFAPGRGVGALPVRWDRSRGDRAGGRDLLGAGLAPAAARMARRAAQAGRGRRRQRNSGADPPPDGAGLRLESFRGGACMAKGKGPDSVDPKHRWDRPLQAPGRTQVDFEERVDFRRLHDYRLARTRAALAQSGLGALLSFDQHNIRYTTSTVIGEWARDKLTRYSLITGNGETYIWDFGSAARHHKLYEPWLSHDQ